MDFQNIHALSAPGLLLCLRINLMTIKGNTAPARDEGLERRTLAKLHMGLICVYQLRNARIEIRVIVSEQCVCYTGGGYGVPETQANVCEECEL